jgi:hypothetical protein
LEPSLDYIRFETVPVETFGKGAAFTRVDKVPTTMPVSDFITQFKSEVAAYAGHIVPSWFLR